jgi:hypothetical protein
MLTNPVFMLDALAALAGAWFFPSALFAFILNLSGFGLDAILLVVSWIGLCVALLAGTCFFFILVRFGNAYYARYTLSASGISCETSHESASDAGKGGFFACRAAPVPSGSMSSAKLEKWAGWDKIRKMKALPSLRVVTLSDAFLPVFRIFCPDDPTFAQTRELCAAMLAYRERK